jgi:hypothetical protein
VWIPHDVAFLDLTIFLEQLSNISLGQTRMDASDEEVSARVHGTFVIFSIRRRATNDC